MTAPQGWHNTIWVWTKGCRPSSPSRCALWHAWQTSRGLLNYCLQASDASEFHSLPFMPTDAWKLHVHRQSLCRNPVRSAHTGSVLHGPGCTSSQIRCVCKKSALTGSLLHAAGCTLPQVRCVDERGDWRSSHAGRHKGPCGFQRQRLRGSADEPLHLRTASLLDNQVSTIHPDLGLAKWEVLRSTEKHLEQPDFNRGHGKMLCDSRRHCYKRQEGSAYRVMALSRMLFRHRNLNACTGTAGCTQPRRRASVLWSSADILAATCKSRYLYAPQHGATNFIKCLTAPRAMMLCLFAAHFGRVQQQFSLMHWCVIG